MFKIQKKAQESGQRRRHKSQNHGSRAFLVLLLCYYPRLPDTEARYSLRLPVRRSDFRLTESGSYTTRTQVGLQEFGDEGFGVQGFQ